MASKVTKAKVIGFKQDGTKIYVHDSEVNPAIQVYSGAGVTASPYAHCFTPMPDLDMFATEQYYSYKKLNLFKIDDEGIRLDKTIILPTNGCYGNSVTYVPKNKTIYRVGYIDTNKYLITAIDPIEGKITSSFAVTLDAASGTSRFQPCIEYVPSIDKLVLFCQYAGTSTASKDNSIPLIVSVDLELTEFNIDYDAGYSDASTIFTSGSLDLRVKTGGNSTVNAITYNPISKSLILLFAESGGVYPNKVVEYDPVKKTMVSEFNIKRHLSSNVYKITNVFVSKSTGEIVLKVDKDIIVLGPKLNFIRQFKSNTDTNDFAIFDPYLNLLYTKNKANRQLYIHNTLGVTSMSSIVTEDFYTAFVYPVESQADNGTMSPNIVYPVAGARVDDYTPTIVFKVGKNPLGFTQQFRVVIDTSKENILKNDHTFNYDRVLDSWEEADSHYVDADWEYSPTFNPVDLTGTWKPLGKLPGMKEKGVVPDNGLNNQNGEEMYVKLTIPESLTLSSFGDKRWFIKVYPFSKNN